MVQWLFRGRRHPDRLCSVDVLGGFGVRSVFKLLYSQSAGDMNTLERSKRWMADMTQGYGLFLFLLPEIFLIGASILVANIF
jgi:hypothetical protein